MRSALFVFLSVSLHAAALGYPLSRAKRDHFDAIRVTILPVGSESLAAGGGGGSGGLAPITKAASPSRTPPAAQEKVEEKLESASPAPQITAAPELGKVDAGNAALMSAIDTSWTGDTDSLSVHAIATFQGGGNGAGETGSGAGGAAAGSGSGNGYGVGPGSGSEGSGSGGAMMPARYRDTPRPDYPDRARREGREGRVLVRVLVDAQGRSKRVEIHHSSGSDALDRAAAEALKRWRFYPARQGEKAVESWLRVPIEFRLEDAKR